MMKTFLEFWPAEDSPPHHEASAEKDLREALKASACCQMFCSFFWSFVRFFLNYRVQLKPEVCLNFKGFNISGFALLPA
jgi:hypothetical protein